jgi:ADP-heptose:LPS heptosyltransferase
LLKRSKIDKILVISLTNIGDVILTFPVIDILLEDFPSAEISVVVGPKAASLLSGNPLVADVYVFDKHQPPLKTLGWVLELRRKRFDLVVDLRNTFIPFMISPRYRTSCRVEKTSDGHMRTKHLNQLRSVYDTDKESAARRALFIPESDKGYVRRLIDGEIGRGQKYVIVAPGAADSAKRWPEKSFAFVCGQLAQKHHIKTVFVGNEQDREVAQRINQAMDVPGANVCGRTDLVQLAELILHASFALVNDSAPMHLVSYLDVPVLALFGPSDPRKYGPWGKNGQMIKRDLDCPVCSGKESSGHTCMEAILTSEVLNALGTFIDKQP